LSLRDIVYAIATVLVFAAVAFFGVLQDRARRRTYGPGTSKFSVPAMLRATFTKETFYALVLLLGVVEFVGALFALDQAGYLAR